MSSMTHETQDFKTTSSIANHILAFDAWLETMHGSNGYGGPIAHWWENCLEFTGAGLDWRYEGIILAYLNLYTKTDDAQWLTKAKHAANDLIRGQLPTGLFRNSQYELNPYPAGTPHEAACDHGLLQLAAVLKAKNDDEWSVYADAATKNIHEFQIRWLWGDADSVFFDNLSKTSFVANKSATLCEALFKHADITGDDALVQQYALPTLEMILKLQIQEGELRGAICQSSASGKQVEWFFPYYIGRCVSGLITAYEWTHDERYLVAAQHATDFMMRWRYEDGSFPQIIYAPHQMNRYPQWIAGVGDILRVFERMNSVGNTSYTLEPSLQWLLAGHDVTGAIRTAHGFASHMTQRKPRKLPEFRDLLPVVGWADKAFRFLTSQLPDGSDLASKPTLQAFETQCLVRGNVATYYENDTEISLRRKNKLIYRWQKGQEWADTCAPELLWK
jgi:hypothetical protein